MVYGYATDETDEYMPLPILIAHKLMRKYEAFRKTRNDFHSDAKSQVSIIYDEDEPSSIGTVLVSVSHSDKLTKEEIRNIISEEVIAPVLSEYTYLIGNETDLIVNPSGKFTVWGSFGDSGCVGRKIVVDTYGGVGRVGGVCFSSKNATKVDRSGAYYARYVAKNIVAHGYAHKCEIQVSYGIGIAEPINIYVDTFGTNLKTIDEIEDYVKSNFSFKPSNIIKELGLLQPIYKEAACFGHFGRNEFPWEKIKN